jgi:isocitrate lyase
VKLLLDINIVLDVVLNRTPWAADAAGLLTAVEEGRASGFIAGHTITTIHCIAAKAKGRTSAKVRTTWSPGTNPTSIEFQFQSGRPAKSSR